MSRIKNSFIEVEWYRVGSESVFCHPQHVCYSPQPYKMLWQLQVASHKIVQKLDERHLVLLSEEYAKIFLEDVVLCLNGHNCITCPWKKWGEGGKVGKWQCLSHWGWKEGIESSTENVNQQLFPVRHLVQRTILWIFGENTKKDSNMSLRKINDNFLIKKAKILVGT